MYKKSKVQQKGYLPVQVRHTERDYNARRDFSSRQAGRQKEQRHEWVGETNGDWWSMVM